MGLFFVTVFNETATPEVRLRNMIPLICLTNTVVCDLDAMKKKKLNKIQYTR